jgi:hypothetical protein
MARIGQLVLAFSVVFASAGLVTASGKEKEKGADQQE